MRVCVCVYIYMYVCVRVCVCVCARTFLCAHTGVSRQAKEKKFLLIVSLYDLYMSCKYIYIYIYIYISYIDMYILVCYIFDTFAEKSLCEDVFNHPDN